MPDTSVRYFSSTMSGAPSITRVAGSGIPVFDACLKDGFGSVTLDSLVVVGNVATCTKSAGHNFAMLGAVGPVIRIEGATPAGLNGDWRVTVTSPTVFTFATSGITDQTATGTITAKRAPLGFSKVYSGTDKAVYQADKVSGLRNYLRLDDTATQNVAVKGYVAMSDVDTGTDAYPTSAPYLYKIDGSRTSAPWWLIGDDQAFYLVVQTNGNGIASGGMFFGDLAFPIASVDAYACGLIAGGASSGSYLMGIDTSSYAGMPRSYTGLAGAVSMIRYTHSRANACGYPCPVNNGILVSPIEAWQSNVLPRGMMPGMYFSLSVYTGYTNGQIFDNVSGLNRSLIFLPGPNTGALFDLTGPWR